MARDKKSTYSPELEKYMKEQDSSEDDFDEDSNFDNSHIGSSKLDKYVGRDEEKEVEEIRYCSICGKELKKFNYGNKCDDCVKNVELVNDINKLLDYMSPSEELKKEILLRAGFEELELNIIISNLLDENLVILGSKGIYLADVKTLNDFFRIYGSKNDILDESLYKNLMFSEGFVDISDYSDLVQLIFNSKNNKWELNLYRDGKPFFKKFFVNILDANNLATHYLNDIGELNNLRDKKPIEHKKVKRQKSMHKSIFFSMKRNQWFVKMTGPAGSKIIGFYDTEDEALVARDKYIEERKEMRARLKPKKFVKNESDALISFNKRADQWVVKVKTKKGGFKKLGYFDTEEEAIAAKNEYYGINDNVDEGSTLAFSEGDRVQVISGIFESDFGIIQGFFAERESFIVKLENSNVPRPVLIKEDQLKLI